MLQETALRLEGKSNLTDRTLVICNDAHRFLVAEQLRAIGTAARIVLEPEGRNTAPAVALAAILALRDTPKGQTAPLLLVMPADHVVEDRAAFLKAIEVGEAAAAEGRLVTFGVVPTYPHTGYGYIEADAPSLIAAPITAFVEKPDKAKAVSLLETNRFFWNAGIFLFRADVYLDELKKFAPEIVTACQRAIDLGERGRGFLSGRMRKHFVPARRISIDYAVMEKTGERCGRAARCRLERRRFLGRLARCQCQRRQGQCLVWRCHCARLQGQLHRELEPAGSGGGLGRIHRGRRQGLGTGRTEGPLAGCESTWSMN